LLFRCSFRSVSALFARARAHSPDALQADIAVNGLLESIKLYEGKILDGRNRYRACVELNVAPRVETWCPSNKDDSAVAYVVSKNLKRRHSNESQRAMIAARLIPHFEKAAADRRRATQNNNSAKAVGANLPQQEKGKARDKAAEVVNTSSRSVESARSVLANGSPELIKAVDNGNISVSAAAELSSLPKNEQKKVVERQGGCQNPDQGREEAFALEGLAPLPREKRRGWTPWS
jgi:hypothetical protein